MAMQRIKRWLFRLLMALVLAGELILLADLALAWCGLPIGRMAFLGGFGAMTLVFWVLPWFTQKRLTCGALGLPVAAAVLAGALFLFWRSFSEAAVYRDVDAGKEALYGRKNVMLIVPHEDDELNVLGGVLEEYIAGGSTVYPVFVTNGDYSEPAQVRLGEALAVAEYLGIPAQNLIFLGYGDQWEGTHIYNGEPGVVLESHAGKRQTYGIEGKAAYREGNAYTAENFLGDLESVILEYRPEVIFCSDYDANIDHRAVSLAFDKVMGRILNTQPDYRPLVFKGFAYATAWNAEADFYAANILSTGDVFAQPYNQKPEVYRWEERVRFPVDAASLSRSLPSAGVYHALSLHRSQGAHEQADRIVNGDRVFWQRRTDSLCYSASLRTSSGAAELLRDFMLTENLDLTEKDRLPCDGTWVPETNDRERSVMITFAGPTDLAQIVLYDNPSEEQNVLDAVIRFDDGTGVNTGPLDPGGAATRIPVEKTGVTGFELILMETEGNQAGLTEIEAFSQSEESELRWIKLIDTDGNFVYDYWTKPKGRVELQLYAYGVVPGALSVSCDNPRCAAVMEEGILDVFCPSGESAVITVTDPDSGLTDRVCIRNPGTLQRLQLTIGQGLEQFVLLRWFDGAWWDTVTYETLDILRYKLDALLP